MRRGAAVENHRGALRLVEDDDSKAKPRRPSSLRSWATLASVLLAVSWFLSHGWAAGARAFRLISGGHQAALEDQLADATARAAGDLATSRRAGPSRALHVGPQDRAPPPRGRLGPPPVSRAGSNYCDDVVLDLDSLVGGLGAGGGGAVGDGAAAVEPLHENASVSGVVPIGGYHYYQVRSRWLHVHGGGSQAPVGKEEGRYPTSLCSSLV